MAKQVSVKKREQLAMGEYMRNNVVADFSSFSMESKLAILQKTPDTLIKHRTVDGKQIPYVDYKFAEKALNFVFNFDVSNRILREDYFSYEEAGKKHGKDVIRMATEAECTVEFVFGGKITRTVKSSHKGYANKATTRGDIMKSAVSKSWTVVARTFGIGGDLQEAEKEYYEYILAESEQEPTDMELTWKQDIEACTTLDELGEYYKENAGKGAAFDKLISRRKAELTQ